jgi:hypothetical protein
MLSGAVEEEFGKGVESRIVYHGNYWCLLRVFGATGCMVSVEEVRRTFCMITAEKAMENCRARVQTAGQGNMREA